MDTWEAPHAKALEEKLLHPHDLLSVRDPFAHRRACVACRGSEAGSYLRLIDSCITQVKAQGPSRTSNDRRACAACHVDASCKLLMVFDGVQVDASCKLDAS